MIFNKNLYKKVICIAIAASTITAISSQAFNIFASTKGILSESVNLRSASNWQASSLIKVEKGESVSVISKSNGWYKVSYNGKVGYIYGDYIEEDIENTNSYTSNVNSFSANNETNNTIYIGNTIKVYGTLDDAKNKKNPVKTYEIGTYNIYKNEGNVLNISKSDGPGAWINKSDIVVSSNNNNNNNNGDNNSSIKDGSLNYVLKVQTKGFASSEDARNNKNSIKTYEPGNYYIYKTSQNGMVNISNVKDKPGAWINPSNTIKVSAPINNTNKKDGYNVGGVFAIDSNVTKYKTAIDALNKVNGTSSFNPGIYYIYKVVGDTINISSKKGTPGGWISVGSKNETTSNNTPTNTKSTSNNTKSNPITKTTNSPSTKAVTKPTTTEGKVETINITTKKYKYGSDYNAKNNIGSLGYFDAGTYYVYKRSNGMINITKVKGQPGAWINPNASGTVGSSSSVKPSTKPNGYVNYSSDKSNFMINGDTTLRATPGGSYVTSLLYGTVVKRLSVSGSYSKVNYLGSGLIGWVSNEDLDPLVNYSNKVVPTKGNGIIIGIDPGHGGPDKGASGVLNGTTVYERDLNFQIAFKTKAALEALGFTVVMSQTNVNNDDYIYNKMTKFNQAEVDYVISIHNNYAAGAQGSLVLYSQQKNNKTANKVNLGMSKVLGDMISDQLETVTGYSINRGDVDFYGDAPLRVNQAADAPSALLELGYLNSNKDLQLLTSPSGQIKFANAIAKGILNTVKKR